MGYLAHVSLYMDAFTDAHADPAAFGSAILAAIKEAEAINRKVAIPVGCHANGAYAMPPRHADDKTVLVHKGNLLIDLLSQEFVDFAERDPSTAKTFIASAVQSIERSREAISARK